MYNPNKSGIISSRNLLNDNINVSNSVSGQIGSTISDGTNDGDVLTWDETSNTWISDIPIQSDWLQTDNTKGDYIKNKPLSESTIIRFDLLPFYGLPTYTDMLTIDLNDGDVVSGIMVGTMYVSDGTNVRSKTFDIVFNGVREGTNYGGNNAYGINSTITPYSIIGTSGVVTILLIAIEDAKVKFQVRCFNGTIPTIAYIDYSIKPLIDAQVIASTQIQSNWEQTNNTALDYIKNKPTIQNPHLGTNILANYSMAFPLPNTYYIDNFFSSTLLANKTYHVEYNIWVRDDSAGAVTRSIALGTNTSYNDSIIARFGTVEMPDISSPYTVFMVRGSNTPQELIDIDYNNLLVHFIRIKGIVKTTANCNLRLWWKNIINTDSVQILAHSYSHIHLLD